MTYKTCVRRKTMHKFFCIYNHLTEKYELSNSRVYTVNSRAKVLAENTLLPNIQKSLQEVYGDLVLLKEKVTDQNMLEKLDESELMLSNLYYSFFASPLELMEIDFNNTITVKDLLARMIKTLNELDSQINIPEYNRLNMLIKNNLQDLLNSLS